MISKVFGILRNRKKKPKLYTFIYCPKCNNELISSDSFVEDNDAIIKYQCKECGNISFWDFAHYPVPVLRSCSDCYYFEADKFGRGYCDQDCDPNTQVKFVYKSQYCEYCGKII